MWYNGKEITNFGSEAELSLIAEPKKSSTQAFPANDWVTSEITDLLVHAHGKHPRSDGDYGPMHQKVEEGII